MSEIVVRDMTLRDCDEASRVVCASFAWAGRREGFDVEEINGYVRARGSERAIRDQFRDYRFWVALNADRICGVVAVKNDEITKLYVDPEMHGENVGTVLFETAKRAVAQAGHRELVAWAAFDAVIPFYEKMSMTAAGRKFDLVAAAQGRNTMRMRKALVC